MFLVFTLQKSSSSGPSRRPRLSASESVVRGVLDPLPTLKSEKTIPSHLIPIISNCTLTPSTASGGVITTSPSQPPLPRLTVITKTLEDGSPQTIIKTTTPVSSVTSTPTSSASVEKANYHLNKNTSGNYLRKYEPVEDGILIADVEMDSSERKHKKSKKHKRHSSKEGHRRHSNSDLHRSVRCVGASF